MKIIYLIYFIIFLILMIFGALTIMKSINPEEYTKLEHSLTIIHLDEIESFCKEHNLSGSQFLNGDAICFDENNSYSLDYIDGKYRFRRLK